MKYLLFILFTAVSLNGYSQDYVKGKIKIDGTISYVEMTDTTYYKKVKQTPEILIKESEKSYYIGVSSNNFIITNIYLKKDNGFQILHASGSLGHAYYTLDNKKWTALNKDYHWAFVDPILRASKEKQDAININDELKYFYIHNQWVGTTFAMGSIRESEFVIDKALLGNLDDMIICYYFVNSEGKRVNKFYPENINQFSNSLDLDKELMNGYLPQLDNIHFKY